MDELIQEALARRSMGQGMNAGAGVPALQQSGMTQQPAPAPVSQAGQAPAPSQMKNVGQATRGMAGAGQVGQSPLFDEETRGAAKNLLSRLVKYL